MILVMEGFEQGQYYELEHIVLNRKADLIATQSGVTNFIAVRSSIPQLFRAEIKLIYGRLSLIIHGDAIKDGLVKLRYQQI